MVVQAKNTTARRSSLSNGQPQEDLKAVELFQYYTRTFTLRSIPMNAINSIFKPILAFVLLFGGSIFVMYTLDEIIKKTMDPTKIIIRTVGVLVLCVAFGVAAGIYLQWLLSKPNDTSKGSYIYVCLLCLVYSPIFLFLTLRFRSAGNLWNFLNAILASYILQINLTKGHTFVDSRSHFIYKFIELAITFIFLLWILPYFAV